MRARAGIAILLLPWEIALNVWWALPAVLSCLQYLAVLLFLVLYRRHQTYWLRDGLDHQLALLATWKVTLFLMYARMRLNEDTIGGAFFCFAPFTVLSLALGGHRILRLYE